MSKCLDFFVPAMLLQVCSADSDGERKIPKILSASVSVIKGMLDGVVIGLDLAGPKGMIAHLFQLGCSLEAAAKSLSVRRAFARSCSLLR